MYYQNKLAPSEQQMKGFLETLQEPIFMLNLLKFRDIAVYPDGKDGHLSGGEAYAIYSAEVSKVIKEFGGAIEYAGNVSRLVLGEVEDLWDAVVIARYPSREALMQMVQSEAYQAINIHREAGLAGQLNIETTAIKI